VGELVENQALLNIIFSVVVEGACEEMMGRWNN
jgi:hypothetical protein